MFDLYCMHGPNTTHRFKQLEREHGHFRVVETGWSKLDPLFDGSYTQAGGGLQGLKRKPLNLYRHRKMRRLLDYR